MTKKPLSSTQKYALRVILAHPSLTPLTQNRLHTDHYVYADTLRALLKRGLIKAANTNTSSDTKAYVADLFTTIQLTDEGRVEAIKAKQTYDEESKGKRAARQHCGAVYAFGAFPAKCVLRPGHGGDHASGDIGERYTWPQKESEDR